MKRTVLAIVLAALASTPATAQIERASDRAVEPMDAQPADPKPTAVRIDGAVVNPVRLDPDPASLNLPAGYKLDIAARDLGNARMLAVAENGTIYLTRRTEGDVQMLRDTDGDGRIDQRRTVARRPLMHGIAIDGDTAYMIAGESVFTAPIQTDGTFGSLTQIGEDLPATGQHSARAIAKGPDGMFYLGIGSTCNACQESSPENAALLRMSPDGESRTIYASGLRHTVGFDWHPRTGQLWGLDQGIDWLGETVQVEELNRIEQGKAYGWPYIYGTGGRTPQEEPPGGLTMQDWESMSEPAILGYDAHASAMQMAFYRGAMFPAAEQGNAFAAFRGSWNRWEPSGYEVVRIRFDASGDPVGFEPFVTGFLKDLPAGGYGFTGRPMGLAVDRDGSLLFTDDVNGVLYRVSYTGNEGAGSPVPRPAATQPIELEPRPHGNALAMARAETETRGRLAVSSPAFESGQPIPTMFSAYGQDVSPPLTWSGAPAGTRSIALLMEDPDAPVGNPYVHWVAWNIPPDRTGLPEAVVTDPQVPELGNLRQGRNTRGSVGYFGPRPPAGREPHSYHFQVFALDETLNLLPGASREDLLAAVAGHVLAKGEFTGTYQQDASEQ